jgi:hypothetical protein
MCAPAADILDGVLLSLGLGENLAQRSPRSDRGAGAGPGDGRDRLTVEWARVRERRFGDAEVHPDEADATFGGGLGSI